MSDYKIQFDYCLYVMIKTFSYRSTERMSRRIQN